MFCNSCGKELQAGQQFCAACGQPVGVARVPSAANRVADHVKVLGVLWTVYACLFLLAGFGLFIVGNAVIAAITASIAQSQPGTQLPTFLHPLITGIAFFILAKGALDLAAGLGLLKRAAWGRIVALVASFLALLNLPLGTALGVYTIWVLLSGDADKQYEKLTQAA